MEPVAVLALAIGIDLLLGEPPTRCHPVGWVGHLISVLEARAPARPPAVQLVYGAAMVAFTVAVTGGLCFALLSEVAGWNRGVYVLCAALVMKSTFSIRELRRAAGRVKWRLLADDLPGARGELRALVSRDTTNLGRSHLAAAAVESVAENTVDSFIAPAFFFLVFATAGALGPAAAFSYRVVNTFDSMIGYHGRYEYLGKAAARCDDLLNWLPARIGALCVLASAVVLGDARNAWRVLWRDHGRTESPNAGWAMSAAAGALHVTLEKVGHYRLGGGPPPEPTQIDQMCRLALAAILLFSSVAGIILLLLS